MKIARVGLLIVLAATCFAVGLYGAPVMRHYYGRLFPESEFVAGDFTKLHQENGSAIVLFSTSTCPYCSHVRAMFDAEGVTYVDLVIDKSDAANKKFGEVGGLAVPLLFIGNRRIRGFNEHAIKSALALIEPSKTDQS